MIVDTFGLYAPYSSRMRHLPLFERHIEPEDLECDEHARTVAAYGKGQWEVVSLRGRQ